MTLLTGSANCVKYTLFAFNFFFSLTGIMLIGFGAKASGVFDGYDTFLPSKYFSLPTFLVVTGVFIFIIAFFGCYGAVRENYCMVLTFSILMILIFIFELAAGISGYVLRNETYEIVQGELTDSMKFYNDTTRKDVAQMWDTVQIKFACCGANNYTDWVQKIGGIPMSCCEVETGAINQSHCTEKDSPRFHGEGCLASFAEFISDHAMSLGGVGIGLAFIQFVAIFFSCYVAREIKTKYGVSSFN